MSIERTRFTRIEEEVSVTAPIGHLTYKKALINGHPVEDDEFVTWHGLCTYPIRIPAAGLAELEHAIHSMRIEIEAMEERS